MTTTKSCPACGLIKPAGEFYQKDGGRLYARCKPCEQAHRRHRYATNEDVRTRVREERGRRYKKHKSRLDEVNRSWRFQKRFELIALMGGECRVCGFDDWRALQVDHINGGGTRERRANPTMGVNDQLKLVRDNPEKYQLLCANCNWIKRHEQKEFSS